MADLLSPLVGSDGSALQSFLYAVALTVIGFVFLVLEIFVVSFGLLMAIAVVSLGAGVYFAFDAGTAVGWLFLVVSTITAVVVLRWGVIRIRNSAVVPKSEISADAGYHHVTERIGVSIGSHGVMVTSAYPTGRAKFPDGECDVQVQQGPLEAGTPVVVKRIDGPIVFVVPEKAAGSSGR